MIMLQCYPSTCAIAAQQIFSMFYPITLYSFPLLISVVKLSFINVSHNVLSNINFHNTICIHVDVFTGVAVMLPRLSSG